MSLGKDVLQNINQYRLNVPVVFAACIFPASLQYVQNATEESVSANNWTHKQMHMGERSLRYEGGVWLLFAMGIWFVLPLYYYYYNV
jgi:hypothetical protein